MNDKKSSRIFRTLHYYGRRVWRDASNLIKWLLLAVLTGCLVGTVSSLFARVLKLVTNYRTENPYVFFLLPLSGILIVFLYQKIGRNDGGTDQVLSSIRSRDDVPFARLR